MRPYTDAEKTQIYLDAMKARPGWRKLADNVSTSLTAGGGRVVSGVLGAEALARNSFQSLTGLDVGGQAYSDAAADMARQSQALTQSHELTGTIGGAGGRIISGVAQAVPAVGATVLSGGTAGAAAMGFIQGTGNTYTDLYQHHIDQGMTPQQAHRAAAATAIATGAVCAALGRVFPGGSNALNNPAAREAAKKSFGTVLKSFLKGAADEVPQEMVDGAFSHIATEMNKGRTFQQAGKNIAPTGHVDPATPRPGQQTFSVASPDGPDVPSPQNGAQQQSRGAGVPITPTAMERQVVSGQTSAQAQIPPNAILSGSGQPPKNSPSALPVPTLEEFGAAQNALEKLKAQKSPLSPVQQQELDAAEHTVARKIEYNLMNQQAGIAKRGGTLHPTAAAALRNAQATLARLAQQGRNAPPLNGAGTGTATPGVPQPQNNASGSRLQFSQAGANPKPAADSDIVDAHRLLSQEEDAFQLGKNKPDTSKMSMPDALAELAKVYSQKGGNELRIRRGGGETSSYYMVDTPRGTAYFDVDPDDKTLRVNSAILDSDSTKSGGGSNVYQLAATFAQQHGLKLVADHTVSPKAQKRRISHMVSSMLRHGTSDHFDGSVPFHDADSGEIKTEVPGWKPGDHDQNLALVLRKEHENVMNEARARGIDLSHLTYDPKTHNIINGHSGTTLTEGTLKSLLDRFEPGDSGVGKTTLLRALVTRSTLQGHSPERRVSTLHLHQGGDPGGLDIGRSDRELVSLARYLYYSRPSGGTGSIPTRRMGDALSERPGGLATAVADVSDHLKTQVPGLLHDKTHVFHSVEDLLNSDYARQHPFSKEDVAGLQNAEGFHDPKTGHSAIIAGNVELRPGESPHDALTRVILHERVGHDGLQTLLGSKDSKAQKHWEGLTQRIKPEELDAIANQEGYKHLAGDRNALAHEWFARQAEKSPHLLKQPGLLRDMWETFKGQLRKLSNNWKDTDQSHLDTHLQELLRLSRKAALKTPSAHQAGVSGAGTTRPGPSAMPSGQPLSMTVNNGQPAQTAPSAPAPAASLKEVGDVLDNIQRLNNKAKEGPLSLDEQRELDHNEKVLAQTRVKNLEKEQQVIRSLPKPRV